MADELIYIAGALVVLYFVIRGKKNFGAVKNDLKFGERKGEDIILDKGGGIDSVAYMRSCKESEDEGGRVRWRMEIEYVKNGKKAVVVEYKDRFQKIEFVGSPYSFYISNNLLAELGVIAEDRLSEIESRYRTMVKNYEADKKLMRELAKDPEKRYKDTVSSTVHLLRGHQEKGGSSES